VKKYGEGFAIFEGFDSQPVTVAETEIFARTGGEGPPVLLLHGYPQTHVIWSQVAEDLARDFTVIAPDLRGYGASGKPPTDSNHEPYSKRAMARDMVELMSALGHEQFFLAGHDRGARVAYRLTLDHPDRVSRLATMDIIPTLDQFNQVTRSSAKGSYHWYFLVQPAPFPETLIGAEAEYFLRHTLDSWAGSPDAFSEPAMAAYIEAFSDPAVIHATCEDYRAGITIDCEIDQADVDSGRKITCPMLAMWGEKGRPHKRQGVMDNWRRWATNVVGQGFDCGHFLPEEAPVETAAALRQFFQP
jgi:haloacetate dehalogenase